MLIGRNVKGYGNMDVCHGGGHLADFIKGNDVVGGRVKRLGFDKRKKAVESEKKIKQG